MSGKCWRHFVLKTAIPHQVAESSCIHSPARTCAALTCASIACPCPQWGRATKNARNATQLPPVSMVPTLWHPWAAAKHTGGPQQLGERTLAGTPGQHDAASRSISDSLPSPPLYPSSHGNLPEHGHVTRKLPDREPLAACRCPNRLRSQSLVLHQALVKPQSLEIRPRDGWTCVRSMHPGRQIARVPEMPQQADLEPQIGPLARSWQALAQSCKCRAFGPSDTAGPGSERGA